MHEARLVGVIPKPPQETIFDQEAVGFGYLVQWPWRVLTPYVNYIQLQTHAVVTADINTCESQQHLTGWFGSHGTDRHTVFEIRFSEPQHLLCGPHQCQTSRPVSSFYL